MGRIIDHLNAIMPIDVTTKEYEAIFGKIIYTENIPIVTSSDYNSGAVANELEFLKRYISLVLTSLNINNAEDVYLEKVINFFSGLRRIFDEEDADLKNRFDALILRNGNTSWMTTWSMIDVFSYFFDKDNIYIIENYVETNLISNGGFEEGTGNVFTDWTKSESGSSVIIEATGGDEFIDDRAAEFQVDSSNNLVYLSQTVSSVAQGNYKVDLFYWDDGNCPDDDVITVEITRSSDGYYWDFDGNWQSGVIGKDIAIKGIVKYTYWSAYIYQESVSAENITIKIKNKGSTGTAYKFRIDEVNFGEWKDYPSFKLLIVVDILAGPNDLSLWAGSEDNLIDRGECESTTPPMIFDETVPVLTSATFARDGVEAHGDTYSYKVTKTVASGTAAYVTLCDNELTSDMHGLVAGYTYTKSIWIKVSAASGIALNEIRMWIEDYDGSWVASYSGNPTAFDTWQRLTVTRTIRSGATGVTIGIEIISTAENNEYFYVDDIRLFEGTDSDIEKAGFFDNNYILGSGGGYSSSLYDDILNIIKPRGVKAIISIESN